eukprot:5176036-Pleurochrysis_carterae.AAC.1
MDAGVEAEQDVAKIAGVPARAPQNVRCALDCCEPLYGCFNTRWQGARGSVVLQLERACAHSEVGVHRREDEREHERQKTCADEQ